MEKTTPSQFRFPHFTVSALSLLAVILLAGFLLLPLVAERLVLPVIFRTTGIPDYDLPVRRVDLFGMDL